MPNTSRKSQPHIQTKAHHNISRSKQLAADHVKADSSTSLTEQIRQLSAQLEQRDRQLKALYEIGQTLTATLDIRKIYRVIYHEIAQKMLGAAHLLIALFDAETETLSCGFAISDDAELDPADFPPLRLGNGPASDTIRTQQPRIVDLEAEYFSEKARGQATYIGERGPDPKSALYVPMITNSQVIGVMQVQHYAAAAFQETDLTLLSILANQAAIAFENARLYASVQAHALQLEQRVATRTQELAAANQRLTELDRMKDQFVSNVSHELRTPLANVKLYLQLLERGRPDKRAEYMQTLLRETRRLEKLIDDLLELSQLDLGVLDFNLEPTDVNYLTAELVQDRILMAANRGLVIDCQLTGEPLLALIDPARFTQVISNLMTNAINYTSSGGLITVCTAVQWHSESPWVTITVRDTGNGIPVQEIPQLFDRFFRGAISREASVPGTGLGLAICKEIVEQMGGRVTVESQVGQGAAFTVWLRPAG
ncbi:MAG TPA: GAF domain-containing sensor histidine kinase [Anaerolineae bacterium]|nr:GAF domain-containing sensor histidine kinase [Anaerolineae bacterium]